MTSQDRQDRLAETQAAAISAVERAEHAVERRPTRAQVYRIAWIIAIVVTLLGVAVSVTVSTVAYGAASRLTAKEEANAAQQAKDRDLAQQAYTSAKAANDTLAKRGQAQVSVPPPDPNDPSKTIVAAATAAVLAALPPAPAPSADAVAAAVGRYMSLNPVTVTPDAILSQVATYLTANPPPPGPQGEQGEPGTPGADGAKGADAPPPPTAEEVRDAFIAWLREPDNAAFLPTQLCAEHGQNFNEAKDLVASDGTRYTLYGCIVSTTPPETSVSAPTSTDAPPETGGP